MFSGIVTTTVLLPLLFVFALLLAEELLFVLGRSEGDVEEAEEEVKALHTCKAEALHDLDKNSIGAFGLSGRFTKFFSDHLFSMMCKKHSLIEASFFCVVGECLVCELLLKQYCLGLVNFSFGGLFILKT